MENPREIAFRLIVPPLYACFLVPVLVGTLRAIILIERHWHLHVLFRMGDIDALVVLLLWGSPVFWLGSAWVNRLSRLRRSVWNDHLHQSAVVYLLAGCSLPWLILCYRSLNGSIVYGMAAGFFLTCLWAVFINTAFLCWRSLRLG